MPKESGTDKIVCTWTGRGGVGYENESGQRTYVFNYTIQKNGEITVPINGTVKDDIRVDVYNDWINGVYGDNVNITSITSKQNSQYLDWSGCQGGNICVISPSDAALNKGETLEASAIFKYTADGLTGEQTLKVNFKISYTGGIRLYPGGYGVCGFDTTQFKHASYSNYSYWESKVSGNVTLPNCTPTSTPRDENFPDKTAGILEFKGWRSVSDDIITNRDYQTISQCEGAITGTVSATNGGNYVACYSYKSGIQLVVDTSASEMVGASQCHKTGAGTYFCESSESFNLPDVKQKDTVMGKRKTFLGWVKDNRGDLLKPGTSVNPNEYATYYAKYETKTVEVDRYKSVYVGQSSFLVVPNMVSCSAASSTKLTAKMQNGQCLVSGIEATAENEYIDVSVGVSEDGSSRTLTYKFSVRNLGANSESSSDGTFTIDVDARIVSGENNSYALNDFDHKMCDKVEITGDGTADTYINGSLTSNNYKSTCTEDQGDLAGTSYFTLCMDPGRVGPQGDFYDITERVNQDSDLGRMIGMIIDHINKYTSKAAFDDTNNPVRIAAHVAIRTVILINGYSGVTESEDAAYESHYLPYVNLAQQLRSIYDNYKDKDGRVPKNGDPNYQEFKNAVEGAVNSFGVTNNDAHNYLVTMFTDYKNYEFKDGGAFQRTVDKKEVKVLSNSSYEVYYRGTITLPAGTKLSMGTGSQTYLSKPGVTGTLNYLTKNNELSKSDPYQEVYDYEVHIVVSDTSAVKIPQNHEEELEYSLTINYDGGVDYSSVRIANPLNNFAKQRMIVFDLNSYETKIYFDINGNNSICSKIDSLRPEKCTSAESCDSSFNKSLFKASGCCSEILDEVTYSYLMNNVCNGECATSTMSNVCSYNPGDEGTIDLYEVKEGSYYSDKTGEYTDAIGTCIVNVRDNYAYDKDHGKVKGTYSSYGTSTGNEEVPNNYFKYDDRGNSINVATYQNNEYCQVTCREDWTFTMGAFGNFVGKNAVLAGTFFQNHDNDIFIEGGRTCYTTYLDYALFMNDLVNLSQKYIKAYNSYANWSHDYSDIQRQIDEEDPESNDALVWNVSSHCLKETRHQHCSTYTYKDGKCTGQMVYNDYLTCDEYNSDDYGYYTLDIDHEFEYEDETKGAYKSFSASNSENGNVYHDGKSSSLPTQDKLNNKEGVDTTYSQAQHGTDECHWETVTDTYYEKTYQATGDHCHAKDEERSTEFDRLSKEMQDESQAGLNDDYGTMNSLYGEIFSKYEQFWNCQHFELNNGSDDANDKANNPSTKAKYAGKERPFEQILTMFDPYVSYTYDESAYMTILQDDNILIEHTAKNDEFFELAGQSEDYNHSTNVQVDAKVGYTDKCVVDVNSNECKSTTELIDVKLSRNKLDFAYYNPESGPWTDEKLIRTYGEGTEVRSGSPVTSTDEGEEMTKSRIITMCTIGKVSGGTGTAYDPKYGTPYPVAISNQEPEWNGGKCYEFTVYYTDAHYIKTSIVNSSFYRNKGIWYTGPNDTREHGETLEEAWDNASKRENGPTYPDRSDEAKSRWSVFVGTKTDTDVIEGNLNIFPVSITTARNLYQYTYEFTQIGSYTDGRLGRVMGDPASLIPQNQRTCFYEVVENLCLCCGDPIVTYTNTDLPTAKQFAESTGYPYDFNKETGYDTAKGTLGYNTTTVALSDLDGASDRTLGNNWTDKGSFFYGGNKLTTNKGQVALEEIQERGEKVYLNTGNGGETPEYSFELRPATLAAIRDYNDIYGYEVNFDNLTLYGRASIQPLGACSSPGSCKWFPSNDEENEEMSNYIANFGHYGSNFLENFDSIVGTNGAASVNNLSNTSRNLEVCAIVKNDAKAAKNDLKNQIENGKCRWIDYIETANITDPLTNTTSTEYYRLAFK